MNQQPVLPSSLPIVDELKPEQYARRSFDAVFHRLDLAIAFSPGKDGIGSIVKTFLNGIPKHDAAVKAVEEKWVLIDEVNFILKKKNRLFRNMDSAYNALLTSPEEFDEYLELKDRMKNIEVRLTTVTDTNTRIKMETEYARFKELKLEYGHLLALQEDLNKAREDRDVTRAELIQLESEMIILREQERNLSLKISDDHIVADEKGVFVGEIFPNIQQGYILCSFNAVNVEDMRFDEAQKLIMTTKPPHRVVFKRYDYKLDAITATWYPLAELRSSGVYIEDPRISRISFVEACAKGDMEAVKNFVAQGEDVNAFDHAQVTAIHAAAVNSKPDIVEFLNKAGATIDSRDKNGMTPLLACTRRGLVDMVRVLLDFGADRNASDRLKRGILYFAVESGNVNIVKLFLRLEIVNIADEYWGYTPLHLAASRGYENILNALLNIGASFYRKSKKDKTAEEVARDAKYPQIEAILRGERLNAPAQCILYDKKRNKGCWIGDHSSLNPLWRIEVGITHCICLLIPGQRAPPKHWVNDPENMESTSLIIDIPDDEDTSRKSWEALEEQLGAVLTILGYLEDLDDSNVLICDASGISTSAAVMCSYLMIRKQVRMEDFIAVCAERRPSVSMSLSMRRGLDQLQRTMDEKKMKRLDAKVRNSTMLSVGF